jgi:diacylglycerol kinase family enzyme
MIRQWNRRKKLKVAIIVNKKSGSDNSNPQKIEQEFLKYHYEVSIRTVSGKDISVAAKEMINDRPDIFVVSGGDGSVSSVAQTIIDHNIPLGILPGGTFNNFARDSGIPLILHDAVKLIVSSVPQSIDVGEVNGKIFINNSSVGLYPRAVKLREKILHKRGGKKWTAMFVAMITVFKRFPLFTIIIKTEKQTDSFKTPFVFIGNNEYKFEIFNLGRRTTFTGGKLHLYTAKISKRMAILKMVLFSFLNILDQDKNFNLQLTENVTLKTKNKTVVVAIDGEIFKLNPPLEYKLLPKKLKVYLPA